MTAQRVTLARPCRVVVLAIPVREALGFLDRARGRLGHRCGRGTEALLLARCACVHTFGMRERLDLVFLDAFATVVRIDADVAPWRVRRCRGASAVIELPAGTGARLGLRSGDVVQRPDVAGVATPS